MGRLSRRSCRDVKVPARCIVHQKKKATSQPPLFFSGEDVQALLTGNETVTVVPSPTLLSILKVP